jgi:hypothetical protein
MRGSVVLDAKTEAQWFYQEPPNASARDKMAAPFRGVVCFFQRLCAAFGWRYVVLVCCVYGVNQGMGEELMGFATQRYYKAGAPFGLGMTAEQQAGNEGATRLPWQIKALYGMMSDLWPIMGLHLSP